MDKKAMLGHKVRRLRQDNGLNQTEMAETLSISPSYLNLIEHNQRPVTVPLLFRLGQAFEIDLRDFAEDEDARLAAGLREVFSDPLFEGQNLRDTEIRELAAVSPNAAEAVMQMYDAFRTQREDLQAMAQRLTDPDLAQSLGFQSDPVEEVRDLYQNHSNHFQELELAAQQLWEDAGLNADELYQGLAAHSKSVHGVESRIMPVDVMQDTLRRYDHHRRRVLLSEALPLSGRTFQLAAQIALLGHRDGINRIIDEANLGTPEAKRLAAIGLAGYFAAAVQMPYERFLAAAGEFRHDLQLLQARFGVSFEQVCHRLTSMQRPGARGVPFFFIRVDNAGNVSKRLSGAGFNFARFGGTCPRWVVHDAFRSPGQLLTQQAAMPDGTVFFTIARTVEPATIGHLNQAPQMAIAVGCEAKHARQFVYADGMDLKNDRAATEIGVSCRVCERQDCNQRAHPPINHRLRLDENVRRLAPFAISTRS